MTELPQDKLRDDFEMPQWELPGWDWRPEDNSWLSSESGVYLDGTSIFFIHGGRIRHQANIGDGYYAIDKFCEMLREKAAGLDAPMVCVSFDVGDGSPAIWVEGIRSPREDDLLRLQHARDIQTRRDEANLRDLRQRRPDLFTPD